jgi:hypothetical protein
MRWPFSHSCSSLSSAVSSIAAPANNYGVNAGLTPVAPFGASEGGSAANNAGSTRKDPRN